MGNVILIVEDDEVIRYANQRIVRIIMAERAFSSDIIVAPNPVEALEFVKSREEQNSEARWYLITDFNMPFMNGGELVKALDALLGERLVARVITSGIHDNADEADRQSAIFIPKPFGMDDLREALSPFFTKV